MDDCQPLPMRMPDVNEIFSSPAKSVVYRRKLELKAKLESGSTYCRFKRLLPGAFNVGLIGSACTALPWCAGEPPGAWTRTPRGACRAPSAGAYTPPLFGSI